jgi:hypothetical protein
MRLAKLRKRTMNSRNSAAVAARSDPDTPKPLASWYTEGFCDAIGDRLLMFDNSGTPSLELLRFRASFATANGFEHALRQRVNALAAFDHRAFSQIRAVERMANGDLVLVSTVSIGKRLSEIFWSPQARTGVHPAFAAWFIRESTAALADLHRQPGDIAHGGLTPDRVILTPEGRLVIVEHVLGSALDRVVLTVGAMQELGLAASGEAFDRPCIDQRTDVIQLGWIALSLLLGRRVAPSDYPDRTESLLDECVGAGQRGSTLVSALRVWLERALQMTGDGFESAIHAHDGLGDLRVHGGQHAIAFAASRAAVEQLAFQAPPQLPPFHATDAESSPSISEAFTMAMPQLAAPAVGFESVASDAPVTSAARPQVAARARAGWLAAALFGAVAIGEAAWIVQLQLARPAVAPSTPVPVVLDSVQGGDAVIVDGREVGVTPLTVTVTAGVRSIRLQPRAALDTAKTEPAPAAVASTETPVSAPVVPAAQVKRGGLRISAPIDIQVLEGERVLGSSVDGPVVATAGKHELDFVNSEFGYRSRQTVEITAGQIVPFKIAPPDGRVSANAVPWAQVSIDGNPVGETPLANLSMPVGEHHITFRHPQLGERTQTVIVKSGALTRVSATFTR